MPSCAVNWSNVGDLGFDKTNSRFILCLVVISFKVFSISSYVNIKNGRIQIPAAVFFGQYCFLDGIGTADSGTITLGAQVFVPGSNALQPCNFFGLFMIRGPDKMTAVWSGSR